MKTLFTTENFFYLVKELLWIAITAMVTIAILYPVFSKIDYTYWKINSAFIFVTLTYFRWSVALRSLPFLRPSWIRFTLFTLNFVLFFYLMQQEQMFVVKLDNFFIEDFGFPKIIMYDDVKKEFFSYLHLELILFATGSLAMIVAFQFRLILSYWQFYTHKASSMLED